MHRGVVRSKTVLVVAVIDGNFDADTGIDQTNDRSRNTDEVGISSVGSTSKSFND